MPRIDDMLMKIAPCTIVLYTDHNPLKFLMNGNPTSAKLLRWSLSIQKYDLEVKHIKGSENGFADGLSRL